MEMPMCYNFRGWTLCIVLAPSLYQVVDGEGCNGMDEQGVARQPTLAEKIDQLFRSVRPDNRREYTYEEAADGIRKRGGETISASYLWELRTGAKDNPRKKHLEAIADFFGVPPAYFFDGDEAASRIYAQLKLLPVFLDSDVQRIALRAADLSPDALRVIAGMIEHARRLEGLRGGERTGEDEASLDMRSATGTAT